MNKFTALFRMNKIHMTSNRGKLFDFFLNFWMNYRLWRAGIYDNESAAMLFCARELQKYYNLTRFERKEE